MYNFKKIDLFLAIIKLILMYLHTNYCRALCLQILICYLSEQIGYLSLVPQLILQICSKSCVK